MAELRPFTPPLPVGPVAAPRERPRRFVSTSSDGLSGYWTSKTDQEIEIENAALAAERARIAEQNLRYTPVAIAQAAAVREADELRRFQERWPDPRQSLRDAHNALHEAEDTLAQCREHAVSGAAHIAQCEVEAAHAQAAVETIRQAQTARLRQQLTGRAPTGLAALTAMAAIDDPVETEAMASAEKARRALIVARAAAADLSGTVREAETAVAAAKRRIEECARAVCAEAARECARELADLERQVEVVRHRLWDFQAVQDYPQAAGRWAAHLRLLLSDPEAALLVAQADEAG
jgi:hypothetical protein